ncbi:MAG: hypothetical protein K5697_00540 [Lachnospiraceae bacterium]|nr:hypothetical protein [Lachnospiraceae bacterium]
MDYSLTVIILILSVFTFFIPLIARKLASRLWRLVYLLPLILSVLLAPFIGWDIGNLGVYVAALLIMGELFVDRQKLRALLSGAAVVSVLASLVFMSVSPLYHKARYLEDFEKAFATMKEHYVLTEEKVIDWDALYGKYRPLFAEAEKEQDEYLCNASWMKFTQEFYDGHVSYSAADEDANNELYARLYGNDYGLSMLRLSDGRFAAVNVEGCVNSYTVTDPGEDYEFALDYMSETAEEDRLQLKNAGLRNGSIITAWNGRPVEDAYAGIEAYMSSFPDRRNEEFYLPAYAAGVGGDSVEISFINDQGQESTVTAKALGPYSPRLLKTIETLDKGMNISNLDWRMVDEKTALFRIDSMAYDMESYSGDDYSEMTKELRVMLDALNECGAERLIMDLRMNSGGSPFMVGAVAALFAPEGEHVISYNAQINEKEVRFERGSDGKYIKGEPTTYTGEDLWAGRDIIVLVNAETISAGDMMTYLMAQYPNVTVMGFTGSNSSCQAVSSIPVSTGSLSYSAVPDLDENSVPIIDTFLDHKSRVPVDHFIPFTEEALGKIFDEGEDYVLDYAINYR